MLADRVFVPLILGNLLGFASIVAYSATPSADAPVEPVATAQVAAPVAAIAPPLPPALPPPPPHAAEVRAGSELPTQIAIDSAHFSYVVDIDGDAYAQLVPLDGDHLPHHGRVHRAVSESQTGQTIAFATIAPKLVSADERAWLGRIVVVDGACRARVDGFAIRAGLSGDGVDAMTPTELLARGEPTLVAHLDACRGGKTARDAGLPAPQAAIADDTADDAPALRALAERDLWASEPGRADRTIYEGGLNRPSSDAQSIETASTVVIHPGTHERYVIVHAQLAGETCSDAPNFELTGVYKVADGGDLVRLFVGDGALDLAQPLIDLDGDGAFEAVGPLGVTSLRGESLAARRGDEYIGCPC